MVAVQSNQSETTSLKEYLRNNTGIHSHLLEVHRFIEKSFVSYNYLNFHNLIKVKYLACKSKMHL